MQDGLPRVITHNLISVDGRVAISPGIPLISDHRWPTSVESPYADVVRRHHPQVLLEGSGSLVLEGQEPPQLPGASLDATTLRADSVPPTARARATRGWFTVVDSRGRVRWQFKEFPGEEWKGWHLLVLVSATTPLAYLEFLRREEIPYLVVGPSRVDLAAAMTALHERLGVTTVVSTAGARLNGALLRAGVVDEIEIEVVPIAVGGTTTPTMFTTTDLGPDDPAVSLRLLGVEQVPHDRVLLRYAVLPAEPT